VIVTETERNKAVIRAFVAAINARDWPRLDELVAPDFVRHSHAGGLPGVRSRDDLKRFLCGEFVTFPDAHERLADLLAEGDRVAARHHFRGTQSGPMGPYPPSGKVLAADYLAIYRLAAGVIVEAWAEWDNLSGLAQLGHHTPNT
jgi:predicted ester cyclase